MECITKPADDSSSGESFDRLEVVLKFKVGTHKKPDYQKVSYIFRSRYHSHWEHNPALGYY